MTVFGKNRRERDETPAGGGDGTTIDDSAAGCTVGVNGRDRRKPEKGQAR